MKNYIHLCALFVLTFIAQSVNAQENNQQLIKNGDFELTPRVQRGTNATTGWISAKPVVVTHVDPINNSNPHYAIICCDTLFNEGFDGINIVDGTKYDFSICLCNIPAIKEEDRTDGNKLLIIQLVDEQKTPIAEATLRVQGKGWQQFNTKFTASVTCEKAKLAIVGIGCAKVAIDQVSLKKH